LTKSFCEKIVTQVSNHCHFRSKARGRDGLVRTFTAWIRSESFSHQRFSITGHMGDGCDQVEIDTTDDYYFSFHILIFSSFVISE
jgi:hypothetical protein